VTVATLKNRQKTKTEPVIVDPTCNGMLMTPREFDCADFEEGWPPRWQNTATKFP
jgi:hypothetical protein